MPAILPREQFTDGQNPKSEPDAIHALLRPVANDLLTRTRVSRAVNHARNDTPECIAPAERTR
jgi:putative SOS response-associated peptidase YedK